MSIESGITKIAEALGALAQSGNAIAQSINRYCDMAQAQTEGVKAADNADINEIINSAVAEFEAEQEDYKADTFKTTAEVEKQIHEAEGFKTEEVAEAESDKPVTFEEAKSVVIDAVSSKGKPAVAEIFKKLGAKNLPGLEPSQYNELVALCKAA